MPASNSDLVPGLAALTVPDHATALAGVFAALERDHVPHLSVNGVIFGAHAGALTVLLMRWRDVDGWGLPGGYVRHDEDVDAAAARMVREVTGLEGVYLRQFHTFGRARRAEALVAALGEGGADVPAGHWALGRVVSVGYVALVDVGRARVVPHARAAEHRWADVAEAAPLMLDHGEMVDRALAALRARGDDLPLGATLLPGAFTMPELQRLYETVLGRPLDRRNFQNRMLALGLVERLPGQRVSRTSRPLNLYRWAGRNAALGVHTAAG